MKHYKLKPGHSLNWKEIQVFPDGRVLYKYAYPSINWNEWYTVDRSQLNEWITYSYELINTKKINYLNKERE